MALQLLVLGLTFALATWAIFSVVAYFSGALGGWLRRRPKMANGLSWLTGGVLVGLGLRLAWPERRYGITSRRWTLCRYATAASSIVAAS